MRFHLNHLTMQPIFATMRMPNTLILVLIDVKLLLERRFFVRHPLSSDRLLFKLDLISSLFMR